MPRSVVRRIQTERESLTPAESRVAEVVASDPESVAFGTVADVAARAGTSGPTVLRLAAKLGYEGFTDLQGAVQDEIARRLRPAVERIRAAAPDDVVANVAEREVANVAATLDAVDRGVFDAAVASLADVRRRVLVLTGEAARGIGVQVASELDLLRDGVTRVEGSNVRVSRQIAEAGRRATMLAIDFHRYERWVLDAAERAVEHGARLVVLTDRVTSPLASGADSTFVVQAEAAGPFDSHVGVLALCNALVAGVAARLQRSATRRLDAVEKAWGDTGGLVDA